MADTSFQIAGRDAQPVERHSMSEVLIDAFKGLLSNIQDYTYMASRSLANLLTAPRYFQDLLDQMDDIGVGSLAIVLAFFLRGSAAGQGARDIERPGSMRTMLRGLAVWFCIIIVEVLHGIARTTTA